MACHWEDVQEMFNQIQFTKKGSILKTAADDKIKILAAKVKERAERIEKIKKEYSLTDSDLFQMLSVHQSSYANNNYVGTQTVPSSVDGQAFIPAGVLQNIMTEQNNITTEKKHIEHLGILVRNISLEKEHPITYSELEFLGF